MLLLSFLFNYVGFAQQPSKLDALFQKQLNAKDRIIQLKQKELLKSLENEKIAKAKLDEILTNKKRNDIELKEALEKYFISQNAIKYMENELNKLRKEFDQELVHKKEVENLNFRLQEQVINLSNQFVSLSNQIKDDKTNQVAYEDRVLLVLKESYQEHLIKNAKDSVANYLPDDTKYSDKNWKNYLGLGFGLGSSFGGAGISLHSRIGKQIAIGPEIGFGYSTSFYGVFGLKFFFHNILYLDLIYSKALNSSEDFASILVGFDAFFNNHLGIRLAGGGLYFINSGEVSPSLDFAILYRF